MEQNFDSTVLDVWTLLDISDLQKKQRRNEYRR